MPFLRRYVSLAIGLASGAKASLLITQWIVRYSEYFLREQEGTSLAIAAEAVQGAPVRLGAVTFDWDWTMTIKSWRPQ